MGCTRGAVLLIGFFLGCDGGPESLVEAAGTTPPCAPGEREVPGRGCLVAGVQDNGCEAGTVARENGSCRPAGTAPEQCALGFQPSGDGSCDAILPAEPCPKGSLAVPGERRCRKVAACPTSRWGDIPVEADTEYVDGAYAVGDSDGTAERPWTTIGDAIAAAASGAVVAVAAGIYTGDVMVTGKHVRLWGVCPELVVVDGVGDEYAAFNVELNAASATELHRVSLTGLGDGVAVFGAADVVVDEVWVHDTRMRGFHVEDWNGRASLTVRRSLVEATGEFGMGTAGSALSVEASVVRDALPPPGLMVAGDGIVVHRSYDGARGSVVVRSSVIERNHEAGIYALGSDLTMEGSVVRNTLPQLATNELGAGIAGYFDADTGQRANVVVRSSVIEQNRAVGIHVLGSDLALEATTVRDTKPLAANDTAGVGVMAEGDANAHATSTLRDSVIERSYYTGVGAWNAALDIEASVVRDTVPQSADGILGFGIAAAGDGPIEAREVSISFSLVERNAAAGIHVEGSATIEGTLVRATSPQASNGFFGRGIQIYGAGEPFPGEAALGSFSLRGSHVEDSYDVGVFLWAVKANIDSTLTRRSMPAEADALYGDGICVFGATALDLAASRVETSARAGLSNFGGSASVGSAAFECNRFHLGGEQLEAAQSSFTDLGGNACACEGLAASCKVHSSQLAPPLALTSE